MVGEEARYNRLDDTNPIIIHLNFHQRREGNWNGSIGIFAASEGFVSLLIVALMPVLINPIREKLVGVEVHH